jgi:hypothetical protein
MRVAESGGAVRDKDAYRLARHRRISLSDPEPRGQAAYTRSRRSGYKMAKPSVDRQPVG